ncbi:hypothetical protein [Atlantibacter hermannii]|uniref:hypothetical protein n=1 Tax=Atlantibacter hermannii TaxID=565 RepID=UPI0034D55F82
MTAQAQRKSNELHKTLWSYINRRVMIEQEVVDTAEKIIATLHGEEKSYLTALLYAAKGDFDTSVQWFRDALKYEDPTIALNYLAYIGASAHNYFHRMELFRLEEQFCLPTMRRIARNAAYCIGDTNLIRKYTLKLSALCDGKEKQELKDQGAHMITQVEEFKKATTLTSNQIQVLCDAAEEIANNHGVNCIGVHYFVNDDLDNAFVIRAETDDPEVLAELNLEMLCLLSSEEYRSLPFTSWFRSDIENMEQRNGC